MATFIGHVVYTSCIITIIMTKSILSLRIYEYDEGVFDTETNETCNIDYSQIGRDFLMSKNSDEQTLWLWPFEDGYLTVHITDSEVKTVELKASIDNEMNWKLIVISWPFCFPFYGCYKGSIEFKEIGPRDNITTSSITFEKKKNLEISIQSDNNFLWTNCKPKVSGTSLEELYVNSSVPEITDQTLNIPSIILYIILAISISMNLYFLLLRIAGRCADSQRQILPESKSETQTGSNDRVEGHVQEHATFNNAAYRQSAHIYDVAD
ncbi:unnamed protein product [Meganyctiphanes norvegica]|uniref:Uncharacterized protein n=1 Tax=Meganyctiphanes norvegica TaxID=48144 RepID=A0AAV2RE93_MEGNR